MAEIISIDDLVIPETRMRKVIVEADIRDLADSIAAIGLMQAPVVQNDGKTLIAGFRRAQAIRQLHKDGVIFKYHAEDVPPNHIPVVPLTELSAIGVKEAELHENIRRVQLTWQERAAAIRDLHEIRTAQAEAEGRTQLKKDTAAEIFDGDARTHRLHDVSQDLIASAYLDDPDVQKASSRKDALKVIRRKLEQGHRQALAKEFDITKLDTNHVLQQGDMRELLPVLPDGKFDLVIADPPYGIDANKFANMKAVKHSYEDSKDYSDEIIKLIAEESWRVTKDKAHTYMFLDIMRFAYVKEIYESCGWKVFRTPLIWVKERSGGIPPWPEHGPRRTYEALLYAMKGDRRVIGIYPDVIVVNNERGVERAAHKPPQLYEDLILRSCNPGDLVLDPCCGTGPVFTAATNTKTIAYGIEFDPEAIGFARARLQGDTDDE